MQAPDYGILIEVFPTERTTQSGIVYKEKIQGIIGKVIEIGKNVEEISVGMTVQCFKGHKAISKTVYSAVVNPDKLVIHG